MSSFPEIIAHADDRRGLVGPGGLPRSEARPRVKVVLSGDGTGCLGLPDLQATAWHNHDEPASRHRSAVCDQAPIPDEEGKFLPAIS